MAIPVAYSWEAGFFGASWAGYDVPRQLFTLTRSSLLRLLKQAGFQAEERQGVIMGLASLRLSLTWWLQQRRWPGARLRTVCVLALLPMTYALTRLADGGRASVAVYCARLACQDH